VEYYGGNAAGKSKELAEGWRACYLYINWQALIYHPLQGSSFRIRKRFSEFDALRDKLFLTFPNSQAAMPPLPPKSVISKFRPKFLETRRVGLQYFLKWVYETPYPRCMTDSCSCILLNPEFSGSPVLKEFLFES
jgi:hypothetical protein